MSLSPLNHTVPNFWNNNVSQSGRIESNDLPQKFINLIAKLTQIICDKIVKIKATDLGSIDVQKVVATVIAREFVKEKLTDPEITLKEWSFLADRALRCNKKFWKKTDKNIEQTLRMMSDMISNPGFENNVKRQLELEKRKQFGNIGQKSEISDPQPKKSGFKIDLGKSVDISEISRIIVQTWLEEEAKNSEQPLVEYLACWRKHIQSRENILNNTKENVNNILEQSIELLWKYYRNIEIEQLKTEISQELGGYMKILLTSLAGREDLPEDFGEFKDPKVQQKFEAAQEKLANLFLEQQGLDPSTLASLKP